jgi:uncharacterized Fe-S cluster-containing radical SAM superfamily protein
MGSYNSCRFRCAYCYANFNEGMIENNCQKHFPDSPALLGRYGEQVEIRTSLIPMEKDKSLLITTRLSDPMTTVKKIILNMP